MAKKKEEIMGRVNYFWQDNYANSRHVSVNNLGALNYNLVLIIESLTEILEHIAVREVK